MALIQKFNHIVVFDIKITIWSVFENQKNKARNDDTDRNNLEH